MPTDVKTGALYPNNARALADAQARGFGNAIVLDMLGNVAETATSNLFIVKDGVVITPAPNGTFLNGITRQRTIALLRQDGRTVLEQRVTMDDVMAGGRGVLHRQLRQGPAVYASRGAQVRRSGRSTARRASCTGPSRTTSAEQQALTDGP